METRTGNFPSRPKAVAVAENRGPLTAPACVHSFVRAVASIPGVKCVVVEDGEGCTVHITTFVEGLTEEKRNEIYALEAETIHANPNLTFDFHVRAAEEVSGNLASISGRHYYAIWGEFSPSRQSNY